MKTIQYSYHERTTWSQGPWDQEPDKVQWQDPKTKLPCLAVRNYSGAWCGYVGVPKEHPLHGVKYNEEHASLEALLKQRLNEPIGDNPSFAAMLAILSGNFTARPDLVFEVHGGLTYSDVCRPHADDSDRGICHKPDEGEPDDVWWFGFDCSHSGDFSPATPPSYNFGGTYRDLPYVKEQVASLAKQLSAIQ